MRSSGRGRSRISAHAGRRLPAGICLLLIALAACGGRKPFNVKPRTALPAANYAARTSTDGIEVQAQALTDEDFLYETFDGNLIAAGILPVRAVIANSSAESVNVKDARFELRAQGRNFKSAQASAAFKRLISYYEISLFNKSGLKESRDRFSEYGLDTKLPLAAGESRQGVLFFLMPAELVRAAGLTLSISRLRSGKSASRAPIELKLN